MSSIPTRKTKEMNFENAKRMRTAPTHEEYCLRELLRDRRMLNLKFRRQHPINNYIADFYCHELKVIIELDGHRHSTTEGMEKDKQRTDVLENMGITVYRITNEAFRQQDLAIEKLRQFLMNLNGSLSSGERAGVRL